MFSFPIRAAGADLQRPCSLISMAHPCDVGWELCASDVWAPLLPSALLPSWSLPALPCSLPLSCQPFPSLTAGTRGNGALTRPWGLQPLGWIVYSSSNLPQMLLPGSFLIFLPSVSLNCFPTSVPTEASSFNLWLLSWTMIRTLSLATMSSADLGKWPGLSILDPLISSSSG